MSTSIYEGGTAAYGPCRNTATHTVQAGCEHEHVVTCRVCDDDLRRLLAGAFACVACLHGNDEDPHECPLLGRQVPQEDVRS